MKPKDVAEALTPFKEYINNNVLIISLLAGVSTDSIRKLLQKDVPIIRAMPNTSAAILKSATAISLQNMQQRSIFALQHLYLKQLVSSLL